MTAVTLPTTGRPRGRVAARLRRELLHTAYLFGGTAVAYGVVLGLREVAPWSTWWPLVTGAALVVVLACRTPDGGTTVTTAGKLAVGHPLHAAVVLALVCLPWLGEWTLTAVRAGTEAAVRGVLTTTVQAGGGGIGAVTGYLQNLIGGSK